MPDEAQLRARDWRGKLAASLAVAAIIALAGFILWLYSATKGMARP
jgi:hypothetical protein